MSPEGVTDNVRVRDIEVAADGIRLGELLKLAGVVDSGGEAKARILAGEVEVNGEVERRRGRQLRAGDVVGVGAAAGGPGERLRLVPA